VLLLITGSIDGTGSLIVRELGENVFRFNFDLYKEYSLNFTPDFWEISNPAGHKINSNTVTSVFWWKAFNFFLVNEDQFIVEEVKYIFREIYHWCRLRGLTKGVPHDFHNHFGKINLLNIASKFFDIPRSLITFNLSGIASLNNKKIVAKSLSSGLTTTNRAMMTTAVSSESLDPTFPWFLQEEIISKADVTVFICGTNLFAYKRDRSKLKGLDWRNEQNFDNKVKEWFRFELQQSEVLLFTNFCKEIKVDWGRIDLMQSENGLIFLEYNANGQWVFLDYSGEDKLLHHVIEYLTN
jgi:hypothetical protein